MKDRIINLISKLTESNLSEEENELRHWQDRIALSFLLIGVFFGFFVLIFSVNLAVKEGLWVVVAVDILLYAWVLILFVWRALPAIMRTFSVVILCYVLGLTLLLMVGPFGGAGPTWLFFFPIITGLLLSVRYSLVALLINMITLVVIGDLLQQGWRNWEFAFDHPMDKWIVLSSNFMLLNAIATLGTALLIRGLRMSLADKKKAFGALEENNKLLHDYNIRLLNEKEERRKTEILLSRSKEALKESELRFDELMGMLPIAYLFVDAESRLVFANRKAIEMFNFTEAEFDHKMEWGALKRVKENDRQRLAENMEKVLQNQDIGWNVYSAYDGEGNETSIEAFASPVIKEGEFLGVQGLVVDVSDRVEKENLKKAKEVAEQANQAISEWLYFIAHELRNPVGGITGYADVGLRRIRDPVVREAITKIDRELKENSKVSRQPASALVEKIDRLIREYNSKENKLEGFFREILSSALRLDRLLNDLLDYSKLESRSMAFQVEQVSLSSIIAEACGELKMVLQGKQQNLTMLLPEDLPEIECDPFRIGQVFRNLFSNAIKFSSSGGEIRVTAKSTTMKSGRRSSDHDIRAVHVTVADNGIGIPDDQLSMVFEKFKQSRKTRSGEGTGLGLPICKEIVEAHRGVIWAESQEEEGTRFHILLPVKR